ncbi:restriction endonuclease subunit S [Colwellia hornerae]|uniref:Restriction endonuclease subunit S n=1 Tax=Colwellia hornerae TaxID=89402 RepID=A0A5C6QG34_9GAMM|nr:restriction endonuclease subunit S [Colwellia hornerae]TWX55253.1 restriction endonuclease subunit S [Colwellia hornerae]TWX61253.1 restriction endonuclease subunit S [Colwellia hornerae]TWX67700.1 restriction endonuclease subunit S [Colwellia hornerae]
MSNTNLKGKYTAYPEYKDSGVEWLAEIPSHWETSKLRYMFSFGKGLTITKENLKYEGVPCVNYGEVHSKYGFEVDPNKHLLKCVDESYLKSSPSALLQKGDLVFADTSEDIDGSGNFTQLTSDIPVFAGYHTIIARPKDRKCSRFYAYLIDSKELRTQVRHAVKGVKVFSITQAILRGVNIWLPSLEEREKIASFLDHETVKIDTLIDKQQLLIKLLKEKRQAVISHAVTKGLNPDAAMKDSGIEWLGEVPEHWDVSKLKWKSGTTSGGTPTTSKYELYYEGGKIPWIRTTDLNNDLLNDTPIRITPKAVNDSACSLLPVDSVLLAMYGGAGSIGKHSLLKFESTINQAVCAVLPTNSIRSEYLHRFYEFYRPFWMIGAAGTRKDPNIGQDDIKEAKILLPPLSEQEKISSYINQMQNRFDMLTKKAEGAITLMQERRTAIISAAVTGKIDVRHFTS